MRHNAISNNRTDAWVTRTGCPKVAKDEVKQARQLEVGVPKTSISHFSTSPILGGMKQTLIFHPMVYGFKFYWIFKISFLLRIVFLDKACASFKSNLFAAAMEGQSTSDYYVLFNWYVRLLFAKKLNKFYFIFPDFLIWNVLVQIAKCICQGIKIYFYFPQGGA